MAFNKDKFSFIELTMNSNGKQSGSGFIGVIMGLTAVAAFIAGVVGWYLGNGNIIEYFDKVLQLGGLSALLMGVRKAAGIFMSKNGNVPEEEKKTTTVENKG
jgi:hypothetical protein